eukprot:9178655-Alexandrium_andersonii.AAC.1
MSASLVGSEMCIRDSSSSSRRSLVLAFVLRVCPLCSSLSRRYRGYHPVSYTHLTLPTICSV